MVFLIIAWKLIVPIVFSLLRPVVVDIGLIFFKYWTSERARIVLWVRRNNSRCREQRFSFLLSLSSGLGTSQRRPFPQLQAVKSGSSILLRWSRIATFATHSIHPIGYYVARIPPSHLVGRCLDARISEWSAEYLLESTVFPEGCNGGFTQTSAGAKDVHRATNTKRGSGSFGMGASTLFHQVGRPVREVGQKQALVEEYTEQDGYVSDLDNETVQPYETLERHTVLDRNEQPANDIGWGNVGEERIRLDHGYRVDSEQELMFLVGVLHHGHEGIRKHSYQDGSVGVQSQQCSSVKVAVPYFLG